MRDRLRAGHRDVADERRRRLDFASTDDFAHQRRERVDLVGEVRKSAMGICCAASLRACSGSRVHLDDDPVRPAATAARASGSTRSRRPAGCDGSTTTGRCVSCLSTGIAAMSSVKRVARLERLDPALAEHHLRVSLPDDVLRRHEQLLDRSPTIRASGARACSPCRPRRAARSSTCCGRRSGSRRRSRRPARPRADPSTR